MVWWTRLDGSFARASVDLHRRSWRSLTSSRDWTGLMLVRKEERGNEFCSQQHENKFRFIRASPRSSKRTDRQSSFQTSLQGGHHRLYPLHKKFKTRGKRGPAIMPREHSQPPRHFSQVIRSHHCPKKTQGVLVTSFARGVCEPAPYVTFWANQVGGLGPMKPRIQQDVVPKRCCQR
jgi:hypothetical protein